MLHGTSSFLQPEPTSRVPVRPLLPSDVAADLPVVSVAGPLDDAAQAYRDFLVQHDPADADQLDSWCESFRGHDEHARLFRDIHRSNPHAAYQLAEGLTTLPEVGTEFLGFRLVAELGRGAFGRVYLAQQGDLANRPVALKISTEIQGESQMLARLQHTHIVPIYSFHRAGPLQAVCMPYFGSTTLADILRDLGTRGRLPVSGKGLVSTLYDRKSKTAHPADGAGSKQPSSALLDPSAARPPSNGQPGSAAPLAPGETTVTLRMLEGMSYVDAVLWVGSCLADGLAHAHERGILHRDLKPANVLLTDYGQPMLLDFNLSEDCRACAGASVALVGGTLPYMAPEHLAAFDGHELTPDLRSDIYSLGIILYELLTGQHPFEPRRGAVPTILPAMIADRLKMPPRLRHWNPAVSPAVEAIVRHCLDPEPGRRYQTARDLREDLDRQRQNLPLRHLAEPSLPERFAKFRRRHPRLLPFGLAALAGTLLIVAATLLVARSHELERRTDELAIRQAAEERDRFRQELREARLLLNGRVDDRDQRREGQVLGQRALERYQVLHHAGWQDSPAFQRLAPEEQTRLRREIGELLMLLAGAEYLQSFPPASGQATEPLRQALRMNEFAENCYGTELAPRALWMQRADLLAALDRKDEAVPLRERARETPVRDGWAHYMLGRQLVVKGQLREAVPALQEATRKDPQNFGAWLLLGNCYLDGLGREKDAAACYTTCIALWPDFYGSYFNRGLALLRHREFDAAEADFARALQMRPDHAESYLHRALARQGQQNYRAAEADLSHVLKSETASTRAYFMRARVRQFLGDPAGARRDLDEGKRRRPTDEASWIARGLAQVENDPKAALADFAEAVTCNPRSLAGLQNQAHMLSERLGRTADAVQKLDQVLEFYPDFVSALGGRGVLLARLGKRDAALRDARATLRADSRAPAVYQVAGIYALTSAKHPADRQEALRLLAQALQQGFGFDLLDTDTDLDPLRDDPLCRELVAGARAARALQTRGPVRQ